MFLCEFGVPRSYCGCRDVGQCHRPKRWDDVLVEQVLIQLPRRLGQVVTLVQPAGRILLERDRTLGRVDPRSSAKVSLFVR